jgi:hypothetical protein
MEAICTAFEGNRIVASGLLHDVAQAIRDTIGSALVYDDATGRVIDLDPRNPPQPPAESEPRGRGRPKLGVVAHEVTLLPRHWDWLSTQPGGASVAIRKLVEQARRLNGDADRKRAAQEAAYHFMSAMAGNLPGFEEAVRALFAGDRRRFSELIAPWPTDVRDYATKLAFADMEEKHGD